MDMNGPRLFGFLFRSADFAEKSIGLKYWRLSGS